MAEHTRIPSSARVKSEIICKTRFHAEFMIHEYRIRRHLRKNYTQIAVSGVVVFTLRRPAISNTTTRRKIGGMKRPWVPSAILMIFNKNMGSGWRVHGVTFHGRYDFTFMSLAQSTSLHRGEARDWVSEEGRVTFILRKSFGIKC